jgi:hypothetical protein
MALVAMWDKGLLAMWDMVLTSRAAVFQGGLDITTFLVRTLSISVMRL